MGRNAYEGFRVKHACGHIEYLEYLLPRDEEEGYPNRDAVLQARLRKLEWLEQHPCQSCYYKDESEQHLDRVRHLGLSLPPLPRLTGTEKQISWGRKIRLAKLIEIAEGYQGFRRRLDEQQRAGVVSDRGAAYRRDGCERSVSLVVAQADGAWWIARRHLPGWELVRDAARLLAGYW